MRFFSDADSLKAYIRGSKRITTIASAALMFILLLSFFTLRPIYIIPEKSRTNAATGTATASESSITLASTVTDTSVVLTPGAGFTLSTSSNTSSYDVITNNYTGYTITLTSEDNDKTLVHTVDNTKVISSINTPIAETDFVSTTSGLMNHFGIKPNKYYDTENNTTIDNTVSSTILPAPGTTGLILDKTTTANSTANNYSIALGAMVDGTIPAGDYTRDTILTVIPNPIYYTINYNKNTDDTVTNLPTSQSANTTETSITLSSLVPERSGYDFIGWCSTTTTAANSTDSCAGTIYNPEGEGTDLTYGIDQTTANTTTLRAMWRLKAFMQEITPSACPTTRTPVYDSRDGNRYYIRKFTYGSTTKCWMTTNLNLAAGTALYSDDSNVDSLHPKSSNDPFYTLPASTNGVWNGGTGCDNTTPCYGYYNYTVATAGTNPSSGNAQYDICPKGWRLPTVAEYEELRTAYSTGATLTRDPWHGIYAGTYRNGSLGNGGADGYYWSSTAESASNADILWYDISGSTMSNIGKGNGRSVRCVADDLDPYLISYDKNTVDTVSNMPSSQSGTANTVRKPTLSSNTPTREHYSFLGWCDTQPTSSNGVDSCSGTTYAPGSTYLVTAGTPSITLHAMWKIDTFTCTKQYRLENADGTWGSYTTEATETVNYGGSCSYSKTVADYRGASNAANGAEGSTNASNIAADTTLSLDFYRNTYELTVTAGTNTSSATGSGTYRWGQTVAVGVTKYADVTCTSYATPTWTATAGTAPAAGASSTYTMLSSNATVTATSTASNVAQTITLSRSGGASGIVIDGTNQTSSSVSLYCGNHTISGSYTSGYEFSSWAVSGSISVSSTSTASTTMNVTGAGTLTLNGKSSKLYLQNVTYSTCPTTATTAYDSRDEEAYTIQRLGDDNCWLLDNLRLDLVNVSLNALKGNTNASDTTLNYLKNGDGSPSNQYATAGVANWTSSYSYSAPLINTASKNTIPSSGYQGKVGVYYNYCAASAGSYCYGNGTSAGTSSGNATEDICPKGWHMPMGGNYGEYDELYRFYSSDYTNFVNALHTPLSGYLNNGLAGGQGSTGSFWSSRIYANDRMYRLFIVPPSDVILQTGGDRSIGYPVRCVLQ